MIEQKYLGIEGTSSLDIILDDKAIKVVFVSATPSEHFPIAWKILKSEKSLFIEKPPCHTLSELNTFIDKQHLYGSPIAMVGMQKRYAPAVQMLQNRLCKEHLVSYDLHYLTGSYSEGNAILDLYIHPLDLICYLFGKPQILVCLQTADNDYLLMFQHQNIVGTLELSTAYSWTAAEESLKICAQNGVYRLSQMDCLFYTPKQHSVLGIPIEKIRPRPLKVEHLYYRNNFNPTLVNNQIYSQEYYDEILSFVNAVEGRHPVNVKSSLTTLRDTYQLMDEILQKSKNT